MSGRGAGQKGQWRGEEADAGRVRGGNMWGDGGGVHGQVRGREGTHAFRSAK